MLVFVDESGDAGLEIEKGATNLFHVALVLFQDGEAAIACDTRIAKLREELGFRPDFEFHFNKLSKKHRIRFLQTVASYDWFYFTITINKKKLYGPGFKISGSFYKYVVGLVFNNAKPHLSNAHVIIDGKDSRRFQKQLATYLRKKMNDDKRCAISKVKIQKSESNSLIQLADMVVGATARSFKKDSKDYNAYRLIIAHREIYSQIWPRK